MQGVPFVIGDNLPSELVAAQSDSGKENDEEKPGVAAAGSCFVVHRDVRLRSGFDKMNPTLTYFTRRLKWAGACRSSSRVWYASV